jgi:hypothetical protein
MPGESFLVDCVEHRRDINRRFVLERLAEADLGILSGSLAKAAQRLDDIRRRPHRLAIRLSHGLRCARHSLADSLRQQIPGGSGLGADGHCTLPQRWVDVRQCKAGILAQSRESRSVAGRC